MYTQEQEQIRMGLHQFFGSILTNSNLVDSSMKRQSLVALVMEELVKVCTEQTDEVDMTAAKPIIRATEYLLRKRLDNITTVMSDAGIEDCDIYDATDNLQWIVADLDKYLDGMKEGN